MKKKAILSVLLIVIAFLLCACEMKSVDETKDFSNRFKQYSKEYSGMIVVDTETNVMYWLSLGSYNYGTLTLLVDQNGNPKIYHGGNENDYYSPIIPNFD